MHITWQGGDCVSGSDIGLTGFLVACKQGGFQSGKLHLQTPGYPKGKGAFSWQSGCVQPETSANSSVLLCPSGWFDPRPGFRFIIKLLDRV